MAIRPEEMGDEALFAVLREDHWTMAVLFQRLSEGLAHGLDDEVLLRILTSLALFLIEHCDREEAYLARTNHPEYQQHRDEHQQVLGDVRAILRRCECGRPLDMADVTAISAMFTTILFPADGRDGLPAPRTKV